MRRVVGGYFHGVNRGYHSPLEIVPTSSSLLVLSVRTVLNGLTKWSNLCILCCSVLDPANAAAAKEEAMKARSMTMVVAAVFLSGCSYILDPNTRAAEMELVRGPASVSIEEATEVVDEVTLDENGYAPLDDPEPESDAALDPLPSAESPKESVTLILKARCMPGSFGNGSVAECAESLGRLEGVEKTLEFCTSSVEAASTDFCVQYMRNQKPATHPDRGAYGRAGAGYAPVGGRRPFGPVPSRYYTGY